MTRTSAAVHLAAPLSTALTRLGDSSRGKVTCTTGAAKASGGVAVSVAMARTGTGARTIAVVRHHTGTARSARTAWLTLTSSRLRPGLAPPLAHRSNSSSGVSQSVESEPSLPFLATIDAGSAPAGHRGRGSSTPLISFTSLTMTSNSSAVVANRSMSSMAKQALRSVRRGAPQRLPC